MKKAGVILILLLAWFAIADRRGQLMQQHPPSGNFFCSFDGLILWIEASRATSSNSPIQNGDIVTNMPDSSCSNSVLQVFSRPIYLSSGGASNNVPYLVVTNNSGFGGNYDLFTNALFTVVMVVRIDRKGGNSGGYLFGNDGNTVNAQMGYDTDGSFANIMVYDSYNGAHLQTSSGSLLTNRWHTLTVLLNGASSLIRTNGVTAKSGNMGSNSGMLNPWRVGLINYNAQTYMNGALLRVLIWNRALTPTEYQAVEARCNSDFGLY